MRKVCLKSQLAKRVTQQLRRALLVLFALISMPLGTWAVETLTFTANEDGSKISFGRSANFSSNINIQYRIYKTSWGSWNTWTNWKELTVNKGNLVEMRAGTTGGNSSFSGNSTNYYGFKMSGDWSVSGELMTLYNRDGRMIAMHEDDYAFYKLFLDCTALTDASNLKITPINSYDDPLPPHAFESMFEGCTGLVGAPQIGPYPGEGYQWLKLGTYCFKRMFYGCTALQTAPDMMWIENNTKGMMHAMYEMFSGCTSLRMGPQLLSLSSLNSASDFDMYNTFHGCNNLQFLEMNPTGWSSFGPVNFGTNTASAVISLPDNLTNATSSIPNSWKKNFLHPLAFKAKTAGTTVSLQKVGAPDDVELIYCIISGNLLNPSLDYKPYTIGTNITLANAGDKVYFRAKRTNEHFSKDASNYYQFQVSDKVEVSGDLHTLLDITTQYNIVPNYSFYKLFAGQPVTSAPKFSANAVGDYAYCSMFANCKYLLYAPSQIGATSIGKGAYKSMFDGCSAMTSSVETLPAANVPQEAYRRMFAGCTAMTKTPDIKATTMTGKSNMKEMFYGCSNITTAPQLYPAELIDSCFAGMFYGCSKLKSINIAFRQWNATAGATHEWVRGVAASGTFVSPPLLSFQQGYSYVPTGWASNNKPGNHLCLTAEQAGSTVILGKVGSPTSTISLAYSTDGTTWKAYTLGTKITLSNIGDKVYFAANGVNAKFSTGESTNTNYYGFTLTGKVAASGNVMSLLDFSMEQTSVPAFGLYNLFRNCTALTKAPTLPATSVAQRGYSCMFAYCSALTSAPVLPATELGVYCYESMFYGCTALTKAPALPATTLAERCYSAMFKKCSKLTAVPVLPADKMATACYFEMFRECTSLKTAPELPATQLATDCYRGIFNGCTALTKAPDRLIATELKSGCYLSMFRNCSNLTTAPTIHAKTLTELSCQTMFYGCTKLNRINVSFTDWCVNTTSEDKSATYQWLSGVASTGKFICPKSLNVSTRGISTVPAGWTIETPDPLCFTSKGTSCVMIVQDGNPYPVKLIHSINNGTWEPYNIGMPVNLEDGDKVCFAAETHNSFFNKDRSNRYQFSVTTLSDSGDGPAEVRADIQTYASRRNASASAQPGVTVSGNIMSLLDNTMSQTSVPPYAFCQLFNGSKILTAPRLPATTLAQSCYEGMFSECYNLSSTPALPATTLAQDCYKEMFYYCESLSSAPALPATTLAQGCYEGMFSECYFLASAPALPATKLASSCYQKMFRRCNSLTTAPALSATKLASSCYQEMFRGCSRLTSAPTLPATTLVEACYKGMFYDCASLSSAPVLPATTLANSCYEEMFSGCSKLTSAPTLPATTLASGCYSVMFADCSSLTSAPALPATTLADYCYYAMFAGCANLTTAPKLPATSLKDECYSYMFSNCSKLSQVELDITSWNTNITKQWLYGVSSTGTFICSEDLAIPASRDVSSVPAGWTIKKIKRGDINGVGNVSLSDLTALISYIKQGKAATLDKKAADVDANGSVNTSDINALSNKLLQK